MRVVYGSVRVCQCVCVCVDGGMSEVRTDYLQVRGCVCVCVLFMSTCACVNVCVFVWMEACLRGTQTICRFACVCECVCVVYVSVCVCLCVYQFVCVCGWRHVGEMPEGHTDYLHICV